MSDISSTDELTVPPDAAGERLDRFLARHVGSRAAAAEAVAAGVLVDGRVRPKSHRLEGGESGPPPRVAYRDEHLLVVDKPAGLVVHPGAGHSAGTLVDLLGDELAGGEPGRPGIVHRLDRHTSGLMVVARSEEAHRRLSALVRRRALERTYLALVAGHPRSSTGRIEAAIGRDRNDPTKVSLESDVAREAVTRFEIERVWPRHALLSVRLETGRTHQIRVHLAAIGLPVVGDEVYGVREPELGRQFLHAARLAFPHPFGGEPVDVESPLPPELAAFLDRL
jgi:23S rRNA pseudouridine1911/1915/1917 synthase